MDQPEWLSGPGALPAVRPFDVTSATFSGSGFSLDRQGHRRGDIAYVQSLESGLGPGRSWFLPVDESSLAPLLVWSAGVPRLAWLSRADLDGAAADVVLTVYLGCSPPDGDIDPESMDHFFGVAVQSLGPFGGGGGVDGGDAGPAPVPGSDARRLASLLRDGEAAVLAQMRALVAFHASHQMCSRCGRRTRVADAGWRRACGVDPEHAAKGDSAEAAGRDGASGTAAAAAAPGCGRSVYPRTDPVAIFLLLHPTDPDLCLLGRKAVFPPGMYSCLAGFVEPGESLEDAVRREAFEESGLRVSSVSYFLSQPWPFLGGQLMLGFFGRALGTEIGGADDELEDVRWFSRADVVEALDRSIRFALDGKFRVAPPLALAHKLIRAWAHGLAPMPPLVARPGATTTSSAL